ncbi:MAG: hypothetical protein IPK50_18360 [Fibrobacterota bacterium]|nr:hypothetical protein [Fibrobacterota bacterium]QQS04234.1 MAG: hypothetical protein IPK50_18360 [Fibrobacterota bacterium]
MRATREAFTSADPTDFGITGLGAGDFFAATGGATAFDTGFFGSGARAAAGLEAGLGTGLAAFLAGAEDAFGSDFLEV